MDAGALEQVEQSDQEKADEHPDGEVTKVGIHELS
jgi:hypothetical protein